MKLAGVAAIVTGGASGLGAAVADILADAGVKVAVLDRNVELAVRVADRIGGAAFACDVADAASVDAAMRGAKEKHGAARVLVNCAGVGPAARIVGKNGPHDLEQFRRVVEINLIGSFNTLRLAAAEMTGLPALDDGERGVIINTASTAAFEGQIGQAAYSASKAGLVGLTLPAARELAKFGVRVVTIAPGLFLTGLFDGVPAAAIDALAGVPPFPQRLGRPEEFAGLVRHICENAMLNGEVIRLDGALRMAPQFPTALAPKGG